MKTIRSIKELLKAGLIEKTKVSKTLEAVLEKFSLAIPQHTAQLIAKEQGSANPKKPLSLQYIPSIEELNVQPHELADPIGDNKYSPVKGLVHRYPDRCLLMPILSCPVYCRFCFRREKVGQDTSALSEVELANAYQYIRSKPAIWEVILTGGDPLILKPKKLAEILNKLQEISTVEVIRIHTRVPVVEPSRINEEMLQALKLNKALYIILHANHADEFTIDAQNACAKIVGSGIPMLGQSVLLKGVNDDSQTLAALLKTFVKNRIKPYYLHHPDLAQGTSHFRLPIAQGRELVESLRYEYSGLCQPIYMLDIPGGYGKVPINDNTILQTGEAYTIKDRQGRTHYYQDK